MPESIMPGIYRIGVVLPDNPLRELNSYLIQGEERDLLIDTGFNLPECRQALLQGLEELQVDRNRLDILLTHHHSDHSGLATEIASPDSSIYINGNELKELASALSGELHWLRFDRYKTEGFPEDKLKLTMRKNPAIVLAMEQLDKRFVTLQEGDILKVGPYRLRLIEVPGHTSGNSMFWMEEQGVMFTGDHVLFDISPNIMPKEDTKDILGEYLDSLRKVHDYPVRLALPGHRKSGDYKLRIEELLDHHKQRLEEILTALRQTPGMHAYETAGRMTWRIRAKSWDDFPVNQQWFAMGECLAHLDHLRKYDKICRKEVNGQWRYYVNKANT